MSTPENGVADHYAMVLADLRAKRAQIDQVIQTLEGFIAGGPAITLRADPAPAHLGDQEGVGDYLGMGIAEAAKKLLAAKRTKLGNAEIAKGIQAGGLVMNSADPVNTVGAVLTRRFQTNGDIVKVGRGIWGLKEWYPHTNFKPSSPSKGNTAPTSDSIEPPQLVELIDDDPLETALRHERGLL